MEQEKYFKHYGVLGMRWGKRKGGSSFGKKLKGKHKALDKTLRKKMFRLETSDKNYDQRMKFTKISLTTLGIGTILFKTL